MRGSDISSVEHHLLEKQACPVLWVLSSLFLLVVEWEQLDGKRWKPQMTLWSTAHWPRLDYCLRERKNTSLLLVVFQSLCHVRFFAILWTAARQASLSFTVSWSLLILMSIESMMPSNHLIFCHPLLLLPSIFPSIRVFSESAVCIRWQKYWSFSFSISPSNEYSGLISSTAGDSIFKSLYT